MISELTGKLPAPLYIEAPEGATLPYITAEQLSTRPVNGLYESSFSFVTYAEELYKAELLCVETMQAVDKLGEVSDKLAAVELLNFFNYSDPASRVRRYQMVVRFVHY